MKHLAILLAALALASCAGVSKLDAYGEKGVQRACAQPEELREPQREKLADWGLWAKCVPVGTVYDTLELRAVE